jgi:hypothetical protein
MGKLIPSVREDVDPAHLGALRGHRRRRLPVEEATIERHVAEGVDVAVPLVVVVDTDVALGETHRPRSDVDVGQQRHVVIGGFGYVDPPLGTERAAERDRHSAPNEPGGGGDAGSGHVAQGSSPPAVIPATPVRDRVEELPELLGRHVHDGHRGELTAPRSTTNDLALTVTGSPAPNFAGERMPVGSKLSSSVSQT